LLEPRLARVIYKTLLLMQWRGESFRDKNVPTAVSVSSVAPTDAVLLELQPEIERISGCRLVPTYSYARLYFHGDSLIRHHDRASCEVSASIHLGRDGGEAGLCFAPNARVEMEEGDGAVYLGCETEHWREPFTGNMMGQMFLHYVVADGPYAAHAFDGSPERFPPSISDGLS
jgi:alkylated DNA repair dioxygenase AlkB